MRNIIYFNYLPKFADIIGKNTIQTISFSLEILSMSINVSTLLKSMPLAKNSKIICCPSVPLIFVSHKKKMGKFNNNSISFSYKNIDYY